MNLGELICRLWQHRVLLAASIVIWTGVFGATAFLMTPVYRATTVLAPVKIDDGVALGSALGSVSGLASLAGVDLGAGGASQMEQALAILRSRGFTERFIADLGLMPELYSKMWDAERKTWKVPADERPTLAQAGKYFDGLRTAAEDKKTGLVKVQVEWKDPDKAAHWANELVARLNGVMRMRAIRRTDAYIEYLEKELNATAPIETRNAIGRLMESQINQRMLANVTEEYAFQVVDRALPPEANDRIKPKKMLLLVLGAIVGTIFGAVAVFVLGSLKTQKIKALVSAE